jgi:hypothetical protein
METDEKDDKIRMSKEILDLEKKYALILEQTVNEKSMDSRTAELEIKMAKLWDLLTDKTTVKGNTKTSSFGKRFKEKFNRF